MFMLDLGLVRSLLHKLVRFKFMDTFYILGGGFMHVC